MSNDWLWSWIGLKSKKKIPIPLISFVSSDTLPGTCFTSSTDECNKQVHYECYLDPHRQERPYHSDSTASRLLSEVKHRRARLVLRWGTTLESLVLFFLHHSLFFFFFTFLPPCLLPTLCSHFWLILSSTFIHISSISPYVFRSICQVYMSLPLNFSPNCVTIPQIKFTSWGFMQLFYGSISFILPFTCFV